MTVLYSFMTDWAAFRTVSEFNSFVESQEDPDEILDQVKNFPDGLKKWIILGALDGEPAFGMPPDLANRKFDLDGDDDPYEPFYAAIDSIFSGFTGLEVASSGETMLDFDEDSRISEAEGTWLIASNNTHWEWESENSPDGLLITFTLTDESDATDE